MMYHQNQIQDNPSACLKTNDNDSDDDKQKQKQKCNKLVNGHEKKFLDN
jgi:hypothetical protein